MNFEWYFRPKVFESEKLYEILGIRIYKRYLVTGDLFPLIVRRLGGYGTFFHLRGTDLPELKRYERLTRVYETIHLVGSIIFALYLAGVVFFSTNLDIWTILLNLYVNVIPVILQRYNRLRLYRVMSRKNKAGAVRIEKFPGDLYR